jgi:hypothetical protein
MRRQSWAAVQRPRLPKFKTFTREAANACLSDFPLAERQPTAGGDRRAGLKKRHIVGERRLCERRRRRFLALISRPFTAIARQRTGGRSTMLRLRCRSTSIRSACRLLRAFAEESAVRAGGARCKPQSYTAGVERLGAATRVAYLGVTAPKERSIQSVRWRAGESSPAWLLAVMRGVSRTGEHDAVSPRADAS